LSLTSSLSSWNCCFLYAYLLILPTLLDNELIYSFGIFRFHLLVCIFACALLLYIPYYLTLKYKMWTEVLSYIPA
jgi:hypothetical protein